MTNAATIIEQLPHEQRQPYGLGILGRYRLLKNTVEPFGNIGRVIVEFISTPSAR